MFYEKLYEKPQWWEREYENPEQVFSNPDNPSHSSEEGVEANLQLGLSLLNVFVKKCQDSSLTGGLHKAGLFNLVPAKYTGCPKKNGE